MVCFGNEQRSFCHFWDCIQVLHFRLFVDCDGYSISSKGFLPTGISCLTTSNLPWFMDLTFQVPMRCCSLQHWTLLRPLDTSTTEPCFHFGPAISFFLELFLCSSLVAYWIPTGLGSSSFSVLSFCFFILFTGFSRQEYWSGLLFLLWWTTFCQVNSGLKLNFF